MRAAAVLVTVALFMLPSSALADRGALTVDAGGGMSALWMPAPFADPKPVVRGVAPTAWVGLRYALRHSLEISASGFFEPPVTYFHNAVNITTENGTFPGTLRHQLHRYGALAGVRFPLGLVWRFIPGLEVGWSRRVYAGFDHINDVGPGEPASYGLALPDFTTDNFVIAPVLGLEWAGGDRWSVSVLPRIILLLGPDATVGVTIPVTVSWSWYL